MAVLLGAGAVVGGVTVGFQHLFDGAADQGESRRTALTNESLPTPDRVLRLPARVDYVALGDSFAAGLGLPPQETGTPACGRSSANYASQLAADLSTESFTDASCAGASTDDFLRAQPTDDDPDPAPQRAALSRGTDLVTLSLGANDFDILGRIVNTCPFAAESDPDGSPCRDQLSGPDDPLARAAQLVTPLTRVLSGVHAAAPRARVVVVGYPTYLDDRTCAQIGFTENDARYATAVFTAIDTAQRQAAKRSGAEFLDVRRLTEGHDICAADPWVAGFDPEVYAPAAWHPGPDVSDTVAAMLAATFETGS